MEKSFMDKPVMEKEAFDKGMDISFLPQLEEKGMRIRDRDGSEWEAFDLMEKYGVNAVRLRLWHTPSNIPFSGGYCSLEHTIAMAKRIREKGMKFVLDFHYSDFWADPSHQPKPKAWKELHGKALEEAVYAYTRDTLAAMKEEGVLPSIVQIGNEIRSGLLFPDGELPDYAGMVALVNAGIRAARDVGGPKLQVMIHLDQGGRYFYLKEWFERAMECGLADFDLIGLSYYPFWHGTYTDLKETMERLIADYHKPIYLVETASAWRKCPEGFIDEAQEKIAGFPASPHGQRQVLELISNILTSLPDGMGRGFYYWEPLCVPDDKVGGWSQNMGILDENGVALESIEAFRYTREQYKGRQWAKIYEPQTVYAACGETVSLPGEVSVLLFDGTLEQKKVTWEDGGTVCYAQPGGYEIRGVIEGSDTATHVTVRIGGTQGVAANLLSDPNWDEGFAHWQLEKSGGDVVTQLYPEFIDPYPAPPLNAVRMECGRNFTCSLSQEVRIPEPGCYCLRAEFCGTDTTGVEVWLWIRAEGKETAVLVHPTEHGFKPEAIEGMALPAGRAQVGVRVKASPMYCMVRKISLYRTE